MPRQLSGLPRRRARRPPVQGGRVVRLAAGGDGCPGVPPAAGTGGGRRGARRKRRGPPARRRGDRTGGRRGDCRDRCPLDPTGSEGESMSAMTDTLPGSGTFARGVHPPERKGLSGPKAIEVLPTPKQVSIPLLQHTGAPCEPTVKPRDAVTVGQVVGTSQAFISAPVHASVAGVVQMGSVATLPNGRHVKTVPIKTEGEQLEGAALLADVFGGDWPTQGLHAHDPKAITQAVRDAGIVGLGGAAFPTSVKFARKEDKPVDVLLVNGCECEP
ncbi:MAG TPA: hypothetical protein DCX07_01310, partial [Phycisphaerales bacterium]|nr:hypothetical protein [Phycisphaerales bacterium]